MIALLPCSTFTASLPSLSAKKGTYFEELMLCYPQELFQRVVTVSLETMRIVGGLPKLEL